VNFFPLRNVYSITNEKGGGVHAGDQLLRSVVRVLIIDTMHDMTKKEGGNPYDDLQVRFVMGAENAR